MWINYLTPDLIRRTEAELTNQFREATGVKCNVSLSPLLMFDATGVWHVYIPEGQLHQRKVLLDYCTLVGYKIYDVKVSCSFYISP